MRLAAFAFLEDANRVPEGNVGEDRMRATPAATPKTKGGSSSQGLVLVILASVQFIVMLDTTFINVSISKLVEDLDTTVTGVQAVISFYALVTACFVIAGAKVGDMIGRKRAFVIGLLVYGIGSTVAALAPGLPLLALGHAVFKGLGAALMLPAMITLITANFAPGMERVRAYAVVPAVAAIGAGVGPIIGGFLTTYVSWRLGFLLGAVVVVFCLAMSGRITDASVAKHRLKFDYVGLLLSVLGLGTVVSGLLLASSYGLFVCRAPFSIGGTQVLDVGDVSPSILTVIVGLVIVALFVAWEFLRKRRDKPTLINPVLFKNVVVMCAAATNLFQEFLMTGLMFALALFAQMILGYDAFTTGVMQLPLSIAVVVWASVGAKLVRRMYPKRVVQIGYLIMLAGAALLGLAMGKHTSGWDFVPSLLVLGTGLGLLASQLDAIPQSSVPPELANEASGLNNTSQSLGDSLGPAIAGVAISALFLSTATSLISQNTVLTPTQKSEANTWIDQRVTKASDESLQSFLAKQPPEVVAQANSVSLSAQRTALSGVIFVLVIPSVLGLIATRGLPKRRAELSPELSVPAPP